MSEVDTVTDLLDMMMSMPDNMRATVSPSNVQLVHRFGQFLPFTLRMDIGGTANYPIPTLTLVPKETCGGFFAFALDTGRLVFADKRFCGMLGVDHSAMLHYTVGDLMFPCTGEKK